MTLTTTRIQQIAAQFHIAVPIIEGILKAYDPSGIQQPPALACDDYLSTTESDGLHPRSRGERRVCWNLFQYLAEAGWTPIAYNDGDETEDIMGEDPILQAMNAIFAVDECAVAVAKDGKRHDIIFVLGNSAEEVVSDHTFNKDNVDGFKALMEAFDAEKFA